MRDLVVFGIFVTLLPACFLSPWIGILVFSWFGYMRTQDLTWGFVRGLPLAQSVAVFMIVGWLVYERRPLFRWDSRFVAILLLFVCVALSIPLNFVRWDVQGWRLQDFGKILFVSFLTASLMVTRERQRQIMLVICGSFAFYGIKNGLFFFAGGRTIVGPGGMLADNNDFAMAMCMNLPFLGYLAADERHRSRWGPYVCWGMRVAFLLTLVTILSTGSRGGMLTMGGTLTVMAWKSRLKPLVIPGLIVGAVVGWMALPPDLKARFSTLKSLDDQSTIGRLTAWKVSWNMIQRNPFFGVGYYNTVYEYDRYLHGIQKREKDATSHVAHNSYLQVWAETGSFAFVCFLYLLFSTIWLCIRLQKRAKQLGLAWADTYAKTIQVSLIAYMGGAMFLNRAHFDLVYQLVAIAVAQGGVMAYEFARTTPKRTGPGIARTVSVSHPRKLEGVPAR